MRITRNTVYRVVKAASLLVKVPYPDGCSWSYRHVPLAVGTLLTATVPIMVGSVACDAFTATVGGEKVRGEFEPNFYGTVKNGYLEAT